MYVLVKNERYVKGIDDRLDRATFTSNLQKASLIPTLKGAKMRRSLFSNTKDCKIVEVSIVFRY